MNNNKYEIFTDSVSSLTDEIIDKYSINIFSLSYMVEEVDYVGYTKGQKTEYQKYYDMLREGKVMTTSQPNPLLCTEAFERVLKEGKDILYICFSSALSGTYDGAMSIINALRPQYHKRKIIIIDSKSASLGLGLLVYNAAQKAQAGESIEDVAQWVEDTKFNVCHYFRVDKLVYLRRGGRIPATSALLGTIVGIKPILYMPNEGTLVPIRKVKGIKKTITALYDAMVEKTLPTEEQTVFIVHADCIEDAEILKSMILETFKVKEVIINYLDLVTGSHAGPGTLGLFFLGKER